MAQRSATLTVAVAIVTSAMSSLGCHPGEQAQHSRMYSTISTSGGSIEPNTLVSVDRGSGAQLALGKVGATPEQFSLAWDARSGFLFGVNPFTSWGVITRIDPETGDATAVATFPQGIGAIAVSPAGQVYGISSFRTLVLVDLSKRALGVVGDIAGGDVLSLDFRSDGTLYGILVQPGLPDHWLVTIDPATASVTSSVKLLGGYAIGDIASTPDGSIYATNYSWTLVRIDPRTGFMAPVGFGELGALGGLAVAP